MTRVAPLHQTKAVNSPSAQLPFRPKVSQPAIPAMLALPYSEPPILVLLSLSGLIVLLNVVRHLIDEVCSAGLIAQIALGSLWGRPLGNLITEDTQIVIKQLGYLGLLLLVAEGGVDTDLGILTEQANLITAVLVAVTGIAAPIGLSLLLLPLAFGVPLLESFACGASLSATSLGTVLSIFSSVGDLGQSPGDKPSSSPAVAADAQAPNQPAAYDDTGEASHSHHARGLLRTRLGVVLVGAALLDDIVALVMSKVVQVIGSPKLTPWTIARPIVASLGLIVVTAGLWFPLRGLAGFVAQRPMTQARLLSKHGSETLASQLVQGGAVVAFVGILLAYITVAHYIGSSPLIGAFCAGALTHQGEWHRCIENYALIRTSPTVSSSLVSHLRSSGSQFGDLIPVFWAQSSLAHEPLLPPLASLCRCGSCSRAVWCGEDSFTQV